MATTTKLPAIPAHTTINYPSNAPGQPSEPSTATENIANAVIPQISQLQPTSVSKERNTGHKAIKSLVPVISPKRHSLPHTRSPAAAEDPSEVTLYTEQGQPMRARPVPAEKILRLRREHQEQEIAKLFIPLPEGIKNPGLTPHAYTLTDEILRKNKYHLDLVRQIIR